MFYYMLVLCCYYHSPCLPPQPYRTLETCRRMGDAYKATADVRDRFQARCVQIPMKDVVR